MIRLSYRNDQALVVGGGAVIWAAALAACGYLVLGFLSPPGLGSGDWALFGLSLALVVGLPMITRSALRHRGNSARALVVVGAGFGLLMAVPLILVATSAETGLWAIVFAGLMASGAVLASGAASLLRQG